MRPLALDHHAAAPRSRFGVLLLAIAIAVTAVAAWQFERVRQERAAVDAELALAQSRLGRIGARRDRTPTAATAQEAAAANAVIRRLHFPWGSIFGALEAAAGEDVALIGIEPEPDKALVRLTAEARTPKAMLQYVRRLERSPLLDEVVLQKHEVRTEDPDKPLRFTVVATWKQRD